jgi:hypothetical protein
MTMRALRRSDWQAASQDCLPLTAGSGPSLEDSWTSSDFALQTFEGANFGVQRIVYDPESLGRREIYANEAYCRQAQLNRDSRIARIA